MITTVDWLGTVSQPISARYQPCEPSMLWTWDTGKLFEALFLKFKIGDVWYKIHRHCRYRFSEYFNNHWWENDASPLPIHFLLLLNLFVASNIHWKKSYFDDYRCLQHANKYALIMIMRDASIAMITLYNVWEQYPSGVCDPRHNP